MTPQYRGVGMTREQFVSNYNQFSAYLYGKENLAQRLTVQGELEEVEPGDGSVVISLGSGAPQPQFTFTEENGVLTAVTISRHFQRGLPEEENSFAIDSVPYDAMTITAWSLLCGRPGISRGELRQLVRDFSGRRESFHDSLDGAEVDCQMDFRGYIPGQDYLFPADGQEQSYDFTFTISLDQAAVQR